jgi:hypothetical protein
MLAPVTTVSPISICGTDTSPLSAVVAWDVAEANVTVAMPLLASTVEVSTVAFVTLDAPPELDVPTMVIRLPTVTGAFPEVT